MILLVSKSGMMMNRRKLLSCSGQMLFVAGLAPKMFAGNPMPEYNQHRSLSFSNEWIESRLVTAVRTMPVDEAIVVNVSATALSYAAGGDRGTIAPWKSSFLRRCTIESGERAALLHVRQRTNLGGVALGWDWYGKRDSRFPRTTPLYISSQDDLGDVQFDPMVVFTHRSSGPASPRRYRLKLNLWYTPEETDCVIHTGHQFLEVHAQVLGTGHMQKFRENNPATLYQDVTMCPGFTHDPFFTFRNHSSFTYPWHRYYADTDCVWMAIELHPL
jgi:hypothetical protein